MVLLKNKLVVFCLILILGVRMVSLKAEAADRLQAVGEEIVIVIDPGHGGENLGTKEGHTLEKEMTLVTAKAMFRELDKYDNVKVYLTHSEDVDMKLEDRAQFAAEVGADFLFSIHYNASECHNMFGSEVWVSCEVPYNAYGYQFGYEYLKMMRDKGLFVRGVKSRRGDSGADYYGIIRFSAERSIPALIIEHCYVDEERDADYIANSDDWAELGRADAVAVAKYFGLKSESLGVDYSEDARKLEAVSENTLVPGVLRDETNPDICVIEVEDCNYETGELSLTVSAADYDSPLLYYDYSIDGGENWSRWEIWPECDALAGTYRDTFRLNLEIPEMFQPDVVVRAYNKADLDTASNIIHFDQAFKVRKEESKEESTGEGTEEEPESEGKKAIEDSELPDHSRKSIGTTTFMPAGSDNVEEEQDTRLFTFLKICLFFAVALFFIVFLSQAVHYTVKKSRRHKKRKH